MEVVRSKQTLTLDYRYICVALLVVIAAMLALWRPWSVSSQSARTVDVTGEATVTARPDEFIFYPSYEVKNADKAAALAELTKKSDELVAKLKSLGVQDSKIKTTTSGYDYPIAYDASGRTPTYSLQLTVTVGTNELAQKVQDYLLTTTPVGSVSPQASFSETKRRQLESQARDEATKNARSKAEQMGKNLGFKIGKVKSVQDGAGFGGVMPYAARANATAAIAEDSKAATLAVQPGENDLSYSVTVVYYMR